MQARPDPAVVSPQRANSYEGFGAVQPGLHLRAPANTRVAAPRSSREVDPEAEDEVGGCNLAKPYPNRCGSPFCGLQPEAATNLTITPP